VTDALYMFIRYLIWLVT